MLSLVLLIDIIIANIGLFSLVRRRENGVPPFIMIICVALFLLVHRCWRDIVVVAVTSYGTMISKT